MTRKGQGTIPAEIRSALDLKRDDAVEPTMPDAPVGDVTVRRVPRKKARLVEQLYGSLRSSMPAFSREEERQAFEESMPQACA